MRRDHVLTQTLELPLPLEAVFPFFATALNLQAITPPELHFKIVTPLPIEMRQGALIEYRLSLFGVPFRWLTEITVWEPPHRFVDVQRRGPYALWQHTHLFSECASGTQMHDEVRYRLPAWPLTECAHPLVRRQLERIFSYRRREVRAAFGKPLLTD